MRLISLACALAIVSAAGTARAEPQPLSTPVDALVTPALLDTLRAWSETPVVRLTLKARNARNGSLDQAEIDRLDSQWRSERETVDQPLITSVLSSPLSTYLTRIQARSLGVYTEIFVMDMKGLNAGQSSITSDYWQGDEAKFQKSFAAGPQAMFVDEPEYNEDSATWRVQVSRTLTDETGAPMGAITIELNLTELERRHLALSTS